LARNRHPEQGTVGVTVIAEPQFNPELWPDGLPYGPPGTNPGRVPRQPDEQPRSSERRVVSKSAADMTMRATKWLYAGRIPAGAITLLAGREGIGKSTIAFDLVAQLTRGELPGRYLGKPQAVGIIATEDSWECVILPRLVAARADLAKVERVEAVAAETGTLDTVSAPDDLERLKALCAEKEIRLILLDPIMSVIAGNLDTHKDREVRQALDPLSRFASSSGVAILGLIHVNKSGTTDPLNSIMASRAFTAVARSVLYCIVDQEAEGEDRYLFGHPKCNVGPKQPTIGYRIVEHRIQIEPADVGEDDEMVIVTSRVEWGAEDQRSIRDAMEAPPPERAKGEVNVGVVQWIAEVGRAVSRKEIAEQFQGIKPATLDVNLGRMVKSGQLERPAFGHYRVPDAVAGGR
jgi:hypothetical protein